MFRSNTNDKLSMSKYFQFALLAFLYFGLDVYLKV